MKCHGCRLTEDRCVCFHCEVCNAFVPGSAGPEADDARICINCWEIGFRRCDPCGELFRAEVVEYPVCPPCHDEHAP